MLISATIALSAAADEQLSLPTPDGWRTLQTVRTSKLRLSAFAIPREQEPGAHDQLSFEWFAHDPSISTDPFGIVEQVSGTLTGNCRGASDQPVFAGFENGYPTVVRLLLCPRLNGTDRGELLMMKVFEGSTGFWIVVRGREIPTDDSAPDPRSLLAAWSASLSAIRLCDPDDPAHPCPAGSAPGDGEDRGPDREG